MRQVILDTETTGLDPKTGHRMIEVGCLAMEQGEFVGTFHHYLNPDREIDVGAFNVHGISQDFLKDKPRFEDIVDDFLTFIRGAELIIHNAPFDLGFLTMELQRIHSSYQIEKEHVIIDTLVLARKKHPGQKNSLDALCKRYNVNNKNRTLHGALIDAELLAFVYRAMTGGQMAFQWSYLSETEARAVEAPKQIQQRNPIRHQPTALELTAHADLMRWIESKKKKE